MTADLRVIPGTPGDDPLTLTLAGGEATRRLHSVWACWSRVRSSSYVRDVCRGIDEGLRLLGVISLLLALLVVVLPRLGVTR